MDSKHSAGLNHPSSGALETSIENDLIAHRFLSRARHLNLHQNASQLSDRELSFRMQAADRFSRSDLYLSERVSESLNPLENYARSAPAASALPWARLLHQASAILVRTRVPGLMTQSSASEVSTPGHLAQANHFLDLVQSLQMQASGLSSHEARALQQIAELVPGLKAWNLNHLQEAETLLQGLSDNSLASEALTQVQTQRRMERCGPLSLVLRAVLRNAYENRSQNVSAYGGASAETPEEHLEHFLEAVENLHGHGSAATYEAALYQVLEQGGYKEDRVLQDFFHSSLENSQRVRQFLHEASDLNLNSSQVREMSLKLAHDLGELSAGYMADLWGAVKNAPLALWETISGREGVASSEYLKRYARLEFRVQDSVGVSAIFHVLSLAATPIRLALWQMGNLLGDEKTGADFLSNLRSLERDGISLAQNGWSHLGYSRSGISGEYEAAERYLSAAREIAQGYQNDRSLRAEARQLLNEDLDRFEGMNQFGEVVRQCTIVGARSQQDILYSAISLGASLSGSYFVGKAVQHFSIVGLRSALISGAVNGMFQTCAQSLVQVGNYKRTEHLTHQSYNVVAQLTQSGFSGAFSSIASIGLTRATFHIASTRLLANASVGGAREVNSLLGLTLKANQFLTGEVFSEMAADRLNQAGVEELKQNFDLGWLTSQREIDRIHGIQEFSGANTPFIWDFLANITGEVLNIGEVSSHATHRFDARAHERQMYVQYHSSLERMGFSVQEIRNAYRMDIQEGFLEDSKTQEAARLEGSAALREAMSLIEVHECRGGEAEDLEIHLTETIQEEMREAAKLLQPKQSKEQQVSLGITLLANAISASTRTKRVSVGEVAIQLQENLNRFYQSAEFHDAEREATQTQLFNHLISLSPKARHKLIQKNQGLGRRLRALCSKVLGERRDEQHALFKNFFRRVLEGEKGISFDSHSSPFNRNLKQLEKTVYSRLNNIEKVLKAQGWMKQASAQDRQIIQQKLLEESLDQKFVSRLFNRGLKKGLKEINKVYTQLYAIPLSLEGRGQGEGVYRTTQHAPTQAQFLAFILKQSNPFISTPMLLKNIQNGQMQLDWNGQSLSFKKEDKKVEAKEGKQESKEKEKEQQKEEDKKEENKNKNDADSKQEVASKTESKPGYSEHSLAKSNIYLTPSPLEGEGRGEGQKQVNSPSLGSDQAETASKKIGPLGLNPEDHTDQVTPELLQKTKKTPSATPAEMFATLDDGSAMGREEVQVEVLQALGSEGGSSGSSASPASVDLRRVSEIIVTVHAKVKPILKKEEQEITLRDPLRSVSVIKSLNHVADEEAIFEDLKFLLKGRLSREEHVNELFDEIEKVKESFKLEKKTTDAELQKRINEILSDTQHENIQDKLFLFLQEQGVSLFETLQLFRKLGYTLENFEEAFFSDSEEDLHNFRRLLGVALDAQVDPDSGYRELYAYAKSGGVFDFDVESWMRAIDPSVIKKVYEARTKAKYSWPLGKEVEAYLEAYAASYSKSAVGKNIENYLSAAEMIRRFILQAPSPLWHEIEISENENLPLVYEQAIDKFCNSQAHSEELEDFNDFYDPILEEAQSYAQSLDPEAKKQFISILALKKYWLSDDEIMEIAKKVRGKRGESARLTLHIALFSDFHHPQMISDQVLLQLSKDSDSQLKVTAALALQRRKHPQALEMLERLLMEEGDFFHEISEAIPNLDQEKYKPVLLNALNCDNPFVVEDVTAWFKRMNCLDESDLETLQQTFEESEMAADQILELIVFASKSLPLDFLKEVFADEEKQYSVSSRLKAYQILEEKAPDWNKTEKEKARNLLASFFEGVQGEASTLHQDEIEKLNRMFAHLHSQDSEQEKLKTHARELIDSSTSTSLKYFYKRLLNVEDEYYILHCLLKSKNREVIEGLLENILYDKIEDPNLFSLISPAIRALAELGDVRSIPIIEGFLDEDQNGEDVIEAARALIVLGDVERGKKQLMKFLKSKKSIGIFNPAAALALKYLNEFKFVELEHAQNFSAIKAALSSDITVQNCDLVTYFEFLCALGKQDVVKEKLKKEFNSFLENKNQSLIAGNLAFFAAKEYGSYFKDQIEELYNSTSPEYKPQLFAALTLISGERNTKKVIELYSSTGHKTYLEWFAVLDQIDPSWDSENQKIVSKYLPVYQSLLKEDVSEYSKQLQKPLDKLIQQLQTHAQATSESASKDSSGNPLKPEKISELRQMIPSEEEDFDLIGPTIDVVKALIAGIMAKEPVLLMGPTGVGKNAVIRWLAHKMQRSVFRVQFHKEMDDSQLKGHFTIQNHKGKKQVVFEEGRMLDAIRYGGWCVFDEINLAREGFLVSLNDLTQQIKSGVVYVNQGGRVVAVPVHENFRLVATGNPEGPYGGRKALEQSVASRWLTMKLREFRVEELQEILQKSAERKKAKGKNHLSEASIAMLPKILENLKLASGEEGLITIRTLKRVVSRIEAVEGEGLWEKNSDGSYRIEKVNRGEGREDQDYILTAKGWEELLRALGSEVLDGLNEEQYLKAKDMIKLYFKDEVGISEERMEALLNPEVSEEELEEEIKASVESFEEKAKALNSPEAAMKFVKGEGFVISDEAEQAVEKKWPGRVEECGAWEDLVSVPTTRRLAYKVLDSLRRGDYVILEGLPAVSKSAVAKWVGKLLRQEVIEVTGSGELSISEMLGVPTINEKGEIEFRKGALLEAITKGSLLVINEANLIPPEVLERLNSLIDDERMVMVTENGAKVPIHAHPNFRLIFTQNPAGMSGGRIELSPALINKFRRIRIRKDFTDAELEKIVGEKYTHLRAVSQAMIQCHRECAKILAQEDQQITLRDLLRWGAVTTATQEGNTLAPDEALMLGAELVYAGRVSQGSGREGVLDALNRLKDNVVKIKEEESRIRIQVKQLIREGSESSELDFLRNLLSQKEIFKKIGFEQLARSKNRKVLEAVLNLKDEVHLSAWIVSKAAKALGDLGDPAAYVALEKQLENSTRLKYIYISSAIYGLCKLGFKEKAFQAAETLLDENNFSAVLTMANAIIPVVDREFLPLLKKLLESHEPYRMIAALKALIALEEKENHQEPKDQILLNSIHELIESSKAEVYPTLAAMLKNKNSDIIFAARSLITLGFKDKVLAEINKQLAEEKDSVSIVSAASVLGIMGEVERAYRLINEQLALETSIENIKYFVNALGNFQSEHTVEKIISFINHPEEEVRKAAIGALGELRDKKAIPELLNLLNDPEPLIVRVAAIALNEIDENWDKAFQEKVSKNYDIFHDEISRLESEREQEQTETLQKLLDKLDPQSKKVREEILSWIKEQTLKDIGSLVDLVAKKLNLSSFFTAQKMIFCGDVAFLEEMAKEYPDNFIQLEAIVRMGLLGFQDKALELLKKMPASEAVTQAYVRLGQEKEIPIADLIAQKNFKIFHQIAPQECAKYLSDPDTQVNRILTMHLIDAGLPVEVLQKRFIETLNSDVFIHHNVVRINGTLALNLHLEKELKPLLLDYLKIPLELRKISFPDSLDDEESQERVWSAFEEDLSSLPPEERLGFLSVYARLGWFNPFTAKASSVQRRLLQEILPTSNEDIGLALENFRKAFGNEFIIFLRESILELNTGKVIDDNLASNKSIYQFLNQHDPDWMQEASAEVQSYYKAYKIELERPYTEAQQESGEDLQKLLKSVNESEVLKDSSGKSLSAEKISELRQLIPPEEEDFDLIGPTIDAAKALISGIMAKKPVLLMGPTGVGKNAVIRWLASKMKRPVYRVQFHKEMDEGQLLGHFTIQTVKDKDHNSPQPSLTLREGDKRKRVVFEEGKLLDAIRYGGWCVFDEINLAREGFLVSLNDITQQIKSGTIYVNQGGKVIAVPVHKDFRLIATGNPDGPYGGRKALEQSVVSRWLTMKLRDFRVEELQTILKNSADRKKAKGKKHLSEASIAMLPKILETLKLSSGEEGLITIRTLKRVVSRIEEKEAEGLWEKKTDGSYKVQQVDSGEGRKDVHYVLNKRGFEELLRALGAEVLDGLAEEKYELAKAAIVNTLIHNHVWGDSKLRDEAVEKLLNPEVSEGELEEIVQSYQSELASRPLPDPLLGKEREEELNPPSLQRRGQGEVWLANVEHCSAWEDLVSVPTTRKLAYKVLDSFKRGDFVILEGLPAVSKSAVVKWVGKLLKQEVIEVTGSGDLSISELLGVPTINEKGEIEFRKGALLEAITRGSLLVVNEANLIPPEVLERLNSLIDDERMVMVTENGTKVPIHAHPNFRLIFTQNPAGMSGGRIELSPALINKFRRIHIRKDFTDAELEKIVGEKYTHLRAVSQAMIQCHRECAKILAQEDQQITLRDLLRWGAVTTATQEGNTLPPDEALMLGAELVYAGRVSQGEGREKVLLVFQKLREKAQAIQEEDDKIRILVKQQIAEGKADTLEDFIKSYSEILEMDLSLLKEMLLKVFSKKERENISYLGMNVVERIEWIKTYEIEEEFEWLKDVAEGEDQGLRYAAIRAIAEIESFKEIDWLKNLVQGPKSYNDQNLRGEVMRVIASQKLPLDVQWLKTLVQGSLKDENLKVRVEAVKAIAKWGSSEDVEWLKKLFQGYSIQDVSDNDEEYTLRIEALKAIANLGSAKDMDWLKALIEGDRKDKHIEVRIEAVRTVFKLKDLQTIKWLESLLPLGSNSVLKICIRQELNDLRQKDLESTANTTERMKELKDSLLGKNGRIRLQFNSKRDEAISEIIEFGEVEDIIWLRNLLQGKEREVYSSYAHFNYLFRIKKVLNKKVPQWNSDLLNHASLAWQAYQVEMNRPEAEVQQDQTQVLKNLLNSLGGFNVENIPNLKPEEKILYEAIVNLVKEGKSSLDEFLKIVSGTYGLPSSVLIEISAHQQNIQFLELLLLSEDPHIVHLTGLKLKELAASYEENKEAKKVLEKTEVLERLDWARKNKEEEDNPVLRDPSYRSFAYSKIIDAKGKIYCGKKQEATKDLVHLIISLNKKKQSRYMVSEIVYQLYELSPQWDQEIAIRMQLFPEVYRKITTQDFEKFSVPQVNIKNSIENNFGDGRDSSGTPLTPEKISELRQLIPREEEDFDLIGPTIDAAKALISGIMAKEPVLLMGPTGVGKNAVIRWLASKMKRPVFRVQFHKEMDEGQLLGHFTIQNKNGKKNVVFEEGRLLDAIRFGGWCVFDEINLAREGFLVSLNDITQQIKSGTISVKQGGKIVQVPVHSDFRLIATGNPEGYGGRKALEQSVASRWLTMKLRDFRVEELQMILKNSADRKKSKGKKHLSEASIAMLPKILETLKLSSGEEGLITIRTLKRVVSRIEEKEAEGLWKKNGDGSYKIELVDQGEGKKDPHYILTERGWEELLRALGSEVLDGLNEEQYEKAKATIKLYFKDQVGMSEERVEGLLNPEVSEGELEEIVQSYQRELASRPLPDPLLGKEREEEGITPSLQRRGQGEVWLANVESCSAWEDLVSVPTTRKLAYKVLDSFRRGDFVILEGLPAVSKSAVIKWIGKLLKQEVIEVPGSGELSISELLGVPTINEEGEIEFRRGALLEAITRGSLLVVNEANLIPPEVLERLNSLIDDERMVMVTENGTKVPIHAHPNFRLIFTQNPAGMSGGRIELSPALINKFRRIQIRKDFNTDEKKEIVYQRLGGKEKKPLPPPTSSGGNSSPRNPVGPISPANPVSMSAGGSSLVQGSQAVAGVNPVNAAQALKQGAEEISRPSSSLNMSLPGHILGTVYKPGSKPKDKASRRAEQEGRGDPREERAEAETVAEAQEKAEAVNAKIAELRAHEKTWMAENGKSLERMATLAAFGHVRVEVDKSGSVGIAALDLDRKVFLINPHAAKDFSAEQLVAIALHEGGHGAISRVIDKKWFKKASLHLLANCVEDTRVNEYELARFPGARPAFNSLYEKIFPDPEEVADAERRGKIKPLGSLPHEQFAYGLIDLWANQRVTERVSNPKVKEAIENLKPILEKISHTYPDCYYPQEKDIRAKQKKMYDLMEEHLLPIYEEFYKESLEEVKKQLQEQKEKQNQTQEGEQGQGQGQSQAGGRSSIDPEDLDEEAKKLLEERADQMAGDLDPSNKPQKDQIDKARQQGREEAKEAKEGKRKDQGNEAGKEPGKAEGEKGSGEAGEGAYQEGDFRPFDKRTVGDMLKQRAAQKAAERKFYENNPWRRYFDPVKDLAKKTAELVKHVLKLNTDHEYVGNYYTGTKLNLKKAVEVFIRNEMGITSEDDFKLFKRKIFPTRTNYKWVVVLDQSGSMKGEEIQNSALRSMAYFVDLMNELKMGFAVVGFADTADVHKSFRETVTNEKQLNALLEELQTAGGGGTNDLEGIKFAEELLSKEEGEQKTVIVITDGAGVNETSDYVKALKKKGIHTIGVGIGEGTDAVSKVYEDYYQSDDFRNLPKMLLQLLVKQIFGKKK